MIKLLKNIGLLTVALNAGLLLAANTDDQIQTKFKDSVIYNRYLSGPDDSVQIQSKKGVVLLTGRVSDDADRALAESTALGISGVKKVTNRLEVVNAKSNEDAWVATKVKTMLMFNRNVSGIKTDVTVRDGVATLRGETDNEAQRELTTKYTQDVAGVKRVDNQMTVASAPRQDKTANEKFDDASITAQAKTALIFHRSTSALRTNIDTNNGEVTITGKAKNAAEKDLVTAIVGDINGVTNVINKMTVVADPNSRG